MLVVKSVVALRTVYWAELMKSPRKSRRVNRAPLPSAKPSASHVITSNFFGILTSTSSSAVDPSCNLIFFGRPEQ